MLELFSADILAESDEPDAGGLRTYYRENLAKLLDSVNASVTLPEDESTAAEATFVKLEIGERTIHSFRTLFAATLAAREYEDLMALGDAYAEAAHAAGQSITLENGRLTEKQRITHASIAVSIALSRVMDGILASAFEDFIAECRKQGEAAEPWGDDPEAWKNA